MTPVTHKMHPAPKSNMSGGPDWKQPSAARTKTTMVTYGFHVSGFTMKRQRVLSFVVVALAWISLQSLRLNFGYLAFVVHSRKSTVEQIPSPPRMLAKSASVTVF